MSFRRRLEQSYGVTAKWAQSTLPCLPLPQITRERDWAHCCWRTRSGGSNGWGTILEFGLLFSMRSMTEPKNFMSGMGFFHSYHRNVDYSCPWVRYREVWGDYRRF
jgi:hypothetical protein